MSLTHLSLTSFVCSRACCSWAGESRWVLGIAAQTPVLLVLLELGTDTSTSSSLNPALLEHRHEALASALSSNTWILQQSHIGSYAHSLALKPALNITVSFVPWLCSWVLTLPWVCWKGQTSSFILYTEVSNVFYGSPLKTEVKGIGHFFCPN